MERKGILEDVPQFTPRYNITPSQSVPVVRQKPDSTKRECVMLRWGLIQSWAKDQKPGLSTINAKTETIAVKPAFRSAFRKRRCLVVADGFYEWQKQGRYKQPMWIHLNDKKPFAFAGLWESWKPSEEGQPLETCTIITTEPNEFMEPIHNRMPVILPPLHYDRWLDPETKDLNTV